MDKPDNDTWHYFINNKGTSHSSHFCAEKPDSLREEGFLWAPVHHLEDDMLGRA